MEAKMSITARECQLQDVLSNRRHFKVANYQRQYEWTAKKVEELVEDLLSSYQTAATGSANSYHFVGSFIFQKQHDKEHIIDGQQRLTTTTIILAIARDLTNDVELKKEIDSYITDSARLRGAEPMVRIEHNRGGDEHFKRLIANPGATTSLPESKQEDEVAERFRSAAELTRTKLSKLKDDESIRAFVTHVMQTCKAIEIKLDPEDDPFQIFASVNGRGQPVRAQDIVRVTLVDRASESPEKRRNLLKKWDNAEKILGADNFERYLLLRRLLTTGSANRRHVAIEDMHKDFADATTIDSYLSDGLELECNAFDATLDLKVPWRHDSKKFPLSNTLYSHSLVQFDEWRPIAVAILTRFHQQSAEALQWLRKLEALAWYWFLDSGGKYDAKDRLERFFSIAKYFRNHNEWSIPASNIELMPNEKRRMLEFLRGRLDEDLPELRPLMLRIEQALRYGAPAWQISKAYTIEHVIPKEGFGKEWQSYLEIESPAEVRELARRLGNLCFVTYDLNREMGELGFAEKKKLAAEARASRESYMARSLCTLKEWKVKTVETNTEKYVNTLSKAWGL